MNVDDDVLALCFQTPKDAKHYHTDDQQQWCFSNVQFTQLCSVQ